MLPEETYWNVHEIQEIQYDVLIKTRLHKYISSFNRRERSKSEIH